MRAFWVDDFAFLLKMLRNDSELCACDLVAWRGGESAKKTPYAFWVSGDDKLAAIANWLKKLIFLVPAVLLRESLVGSGATR